VNLCGVAATSLTYLEVYRTASVPTAA
jgi:hypothetical protein